jgi:hypothetical protein
VAEPFPIHRVDRSQAEAQEPLGSKPKFWFREGERRLLFKADDRGTGEDWAEVIATHLCALLGVPHVEYELAQEFDGAVALHPGVICENMASSGVYLALGNQMLLSQDLQYPTQQRFKVRQHTIEAVANIVSALQPPMADWVTHVPKGVESALDVFIGYVMLDAWISNQDRHHENWGALWPLRQQSLVMHLYLAPTFDHGASLARNLTDGERSERLSTKDWNRTVGAFAKRARSAFYATGTDTRSLGTLEAFLAFAKRSPAAKHAWLERLLAVKASDISSILERVPPERMSPVCKEFTLALLNENRRRLLETTNL